MLITAAPCSIAVAIWFVERRQVISSGSGTLSARAPGQTPRIPMPLAGAAAIDAVAVPCESVTGNRGSVVVLPPCHSACAGSSWTSTSAISGLAAGSTAGGTSDGSATTSRQLSGAADSGSGGTARCGSASVFGCAYTSRPRRSSAAANARARLGATA